MTLPPPTGIPAGWYPDPEAPDVQRWWDGYRWTENFQPREIAAPAYQQPMLQYVVPYTNQLAGWSLAMGILAILPALTIIGIFLSPIPAILAICFGHAARSKARRLGGLGNTMATWGIWLGWIPALFIGIAWIYGAVTGN
jgi:hypothetical protein